MLFASLAKEDILNAAKAQNYIPLYSKFFSLTDTNYNNINLNNPLTLCDVEENIENKMSNYICNSKLVDNNKKTYDRAVFFKFSPLLDPVKYMVGKYDISNNNLLSLSLYIVL